jgi:hypothetical protein
MSTLKNATPTEILNALDQSQERVVVNVISGRPMSRAEVHYHKESDTCFKHNGKLSIKKLSPKDCKYMNITAKQNNKLYDEATARQYILCSLKGAQRSEGGIEKQSKASPHSFCYRIKDSGTSGPKIKSRAKKSA